jgi:hypothetical protein
MRPLPSEVIAGVRRILKGTIEPELTSEHARSRLAEVRAVLAQVDWDDAAFVLAARNRSLAGVLGQVERWRAENPERARAIPASDVRLPDEDRLVAHQAAYAALAAAVVALVGPLHDWLSDHPDDVEAGDLHQALLAAL